MELTDEDRLKLARDAIEYLLANKTDKAQNLIMKLVNLMISMFTTKATV